MEAGFRAFFRVLQGSETPFDPFPWQVRLARQVLEGRRTGAFPPLLHLPTASGKTSLIDVAVFALAWEALHSPLERHLPMRVVFIIDRRIVVDDAHRRAARLAEQLVAVLETEPIDEERRQVRALAQALQGLARQGIPPGTRLEALAKPLQVKVLRGGLPRDPSLSASPSQPQVILSTVDQVGSRLLFRGYGVSDGSKPMHAALLAHDSLLILDEAHLSRPFEQLLERLPRLLRQEAQPVGRPLQVLRMTATPAEKGERAFSLDADDRANPALKQRREAQKWATLTELADSSKGEEQPDKPLLDAALSWVKALFGDTRLGTATQSGTAPSSTVQTDTAQGPSATTPAPVRVIGVVVNRVATARALYTHLASHLTTSPGIEVSLLTGRSRPFDRDLRVEALLPTIAAGRKKADQGSNPATPLQVVVATQCIEAGADLDFDALISECAPLDSLRQRLGRLDRLGARGSSSVRIFVRKSQLSEKKPDPVYGPALAHTWRLLESLAKSVPDGTAADPPAETPARAKKSGAPGLDLGIAGLELALTRDPAPDTAPCLAPRKDGPCLLPGHLDLWCQTSPSPRVDPDPAPFLHGEDEPRAEVQLVWRCDIPADWDNQEEALQVPPAGQSKKSTVQSRSGTEGSRTPGGAKGTQKASLALEPDLELEDTLTRLELLPPGAAEVLSLPLPVARRWLEERLERRQGHSSQKRLRRADPNAEPPPEDLTTDQEGLGGMAEETRPRAHPVGGRVLVWQGERSRLCRPAELKPGETVVISSLLGGLDAFGWAPESLEPVEDVAEAVRSTQSGKPTLRLTPVSSPPWRRALGEAGLALKHAEKDEQAEALRALEALLSRLLGRPEPAPVQTGTTDAPTNETAAEKTAAEKTDNTVTNNTAPPLQAPAWVLPVLRPLLTALQRRRTALQRLPYGAGLLLQHRTPNLQRGEGDFTTDSPGSSTTGVDVTLEAHLLGVETWSRYHAHAARLSAALAEDLALAGRWHDLGKGEPRFQTLLRDGDEAAVSRYALLAKSRAGRSSARSLEALKNRLPPPGFRHEALSVALLQEHPLLKQAHDPELLLHLVGSHHGYARPFLPAMEDPAPTTLTLTVLDETFSAQTDHGLWQASAGVAERFWTLTCRYGWYGLAWLETLLRLADHRRSEDEQQGGAS